VDAAEVLVVGEGDEVGLLPPKRVALRTHQLLYVLLVGTVHHVHCARPIALDAHLELVRPHLDYHPLTQPTITRFSSIFSKIFRKVPLLLPQSLMKYCSLW
jgi:hypothetical protein